MRCFDLARLRVPAGHMLFVDDTGLANEHQAYFRIDGRTYAGRGVLAADNGGEDETGATVSIEEVRSQVEFLPIGTRVAVTMPVVTVLWGIDDIDRIFG